MSNGDYLPGEPWPAGPVPPEPAGEFEKDTHTMTPRMTAPEIAEKAAALISGDRNSTHGDPKVNHNNIAALWAAYLGERAPGGITANDVALMMVLLKVARTKVGRHNLDDYVDGSAYIAIAGSIAEEA